MACERRTENVERRITTFFVLRWAFYLLAFVAVVVGGTASGRPARQRPSFASESSELVVLPVIVTDRQGKLVADLPVDRFTVYDNGRRQPIALFSNEDTPVTVGLILDDSRSMAPKLGEVIAAAVAFARSSNPQDQLFAIAFNDSVHDALSGRQLAASDLTGIEAAITRARRHSSRCWRGRASRTSQSMRSACSIPTTAIPTRVF